MTDEIPDLKEMMNGAQPAPVNSSIVNMLQTVLDQARRGQVHAIAMVGVNGMNFMSFDVLGIDNLLLAPICIGALETVKSKIVDGIKQAQQVQPASRIVRAAPGAVPPLS